MDLYFVLLPIILFYQTPPHEHSIWSFRICNIVPLLSFKAPLCCVHTDKKYYKYLNNASLNTCHTPLPAIFRARRHSPVICPRRGTLKEHLSLFPHHPTPPLRGGQLSQFVQLTITLHHAAPINPLTHQLSDKSFSSWFHILYYYFLSCSFMQSQAKGPKQNYLVRAFCTEDRDEVIEAA